MRISIEAAPEDQSKIAAASESQSHMIILNIASLRHPGQTVLSMRAVCCPSCQCAYWVDDTIMDGPSYCPYCGMSSGLKLKQ
jgi:predicted  nucleic acid-binding Zn ribbon protein